MGEKILSRSKRRAQRRPRGPLNVIGQEIRTEHQRVRRQFTPGVSRKFSSSLYFPGPKAQRTREHTLGSSGRASSCLVVVCVDCCCILFVLLLLSLLHFFVLFSLLHFCVCYCCFHCCIRLCCCCTPLVLPSSHSPRTPLALVLISCSPHTSLAIVLPSRSPRARAPLVLHSHARAY